MKDDRADRSKTRKGSMAASLLSRRMAQDVSVENLAAFNSTKKKVFAMIPFDRIGSLM